MSSNFRIVWNSLTKETLVSAVHTDLDAKLNGEGGQLLFAFKLGKITYADMCEKYGAFTLKCATLGIIQGGQPDYAITHVSSEYQLKRIQIELSRLCNLRCSYCYSTSGPTAKSKLSNERVIEFIDDAFELGCLWIDFTGGEPLAYAGWEKVIGYAVDKGMVCSLHTNGTLLSVSNVQKLLKTGLRHVQTSLDSHISSVHDQARGQAGAYDKTVRGIKRLQESGISIKVSIVAHKGNRDHFAEAVHYFRNHLKTKVLMDRVIRAGGELSAGAGLTTQEYYDLIRPIIQTGVAESRVCDNFVTNEFKVEPHCGVAHSFLYITADGEFALCPTMTSRDNSALFNSPRMNQYSLKDAWVASDYINRYRGLNCRNTSRCPAAKTCGGGCRSNAYIETGELDSPDFLSCNVSKNFSGRFVDFGAIYSTSK